jgi:hypothetical protein
VESERRGGVRAGIGEVDDVAATLDGRLEERQRARLERPGGVDDDVLGLERTREPAAILDVDVDVAARARRDHRADAAGGEPARDDAAEEPVAEHDDASQRSFIPR